MLWEGGALLGAPVAHAELRHARDDRALVRQAPRRLRRAPLQIRRQLTHLRF